MADSPRPPAVAGPAVSLPENVAGTYAYWLCGAPGCPDWQGPSRLSARRLVLFARPIDAPGTLPPDVRPLLLHEYESRMFSSSRPRPNACEVTFKARAPWAAYLSRWERGGDSALSVLFSAGVDAGSYADFRPAPPAADGADSLQGAQAYYGLSGDSGGPKRPDPAGLHRIGPAALELCVAGARAMAPRRRAHPNFPDE